MAPLSIVEDIFGKMAAVSGVEISLDDMAVGLTPMRIKVVSCLCLEYVIGTSSDVPKKVLYKAFLKWLYRNPF